ncbi:MAG: helix-turn-helix domain-containing protein [Chloroflexia bacterium]
MPTSDQFDDEDQASATTGPSAPEQAIEGADESLEPRHVQQVVSVRLGASSETIFVQRTEMLDLGGPLAGDPGGDLWDEHARALGMSRPVPRPSTPGDTAEPRQAPQSRPFRSGVRREPAGRGRTGFIAFGSKSRLPARMTRTQLDAYLKQERAMSLDARDPLAITYSAERYNLISAAVHELPDGEVLDLLKPVLTVAQVSKILGYNTKEVRRLLGQGKLNGRKVGSEWRVPLRAVL